MTRYPYEKQARAMIERLGDGIWRSLSDMERDLNYRYAQTAVSARVRDLRRGIPGMETWTAERKVEEGKNFYRVMRRTVPRPVVQGEQIGLFA